MDLSEFEFISLTDSSDIPPFECRDEDLNDFLLNDAKFYLKELMAVTYLIIDKKENQTVAYFSLLNDKVSYDIDNKTIWNRLSRKISNRKRRKSYPSVKIGRLAVSRHYDNNGIGSELLNFIKFFFTKSNKTGCRFLTVDAYSKAISFYRKNGFDFFTEKDKNEKTRLMFYDLKPFKDALTE